MVEALLMSFRVVGESEEEERTDAGAVRLTKRRYSDEVRECTFS